LALQRASMSLGFGAFTTLLRATAISCQGVGIHGSVSGIDARSHQIAAKNERGGAAAGRVICLPPPDLPEARAPLKPQRRNVALADREKARARAQPHERAKMDVEQLPRQSPPPPGRGDSDRQDLRLVENQS